MVALGVCSFLRGQTQAKRITPSEARDHIGEMATVFGKVASTKYATASRGKPTFINLHKPYPNQIFTIVIWGSNRSKFGQPEVTYRGKSVCVSGTIKEYRGVPEVIAYEPAQVKIQSAGEK